MHPVSISDPSHINDQISHQWQSQNPGRKVVEIEMGLLPISLIVPCVIRKLFQVSYIDPSLPKHLPLAFCEIFTYCENFRLYQNN